MHNLDEHKKSLQMMNITSHPTYISA